jgi:phospholipid transport system substrate-binding protein
MGKALAAWLMVAGAMAASAGSPREVVQSAVNRVIVVLQQQESDRSESEPAARLRIERHRAEIRRIAGDLFDFDDMARRTLSRHWTARTSEEQAEFVRLFTALLERSYIGRIEAYSGEKITYAGETIEDGFATVRSRVQTGKRTETSVDYRLQLRDNRWKVYDVLVDGVSFVSTYRSEFSRIIQKSSYAVLADKLRKRAIDTAVLDRGGRPTPTTVSAPRVTN